MNGYLIQGNGSINILSDIITSTNLVAVGAVQASTAAISGNSTFGGAVTINGTTTGTVGNFLTSVTTGTLNATTELQVVGPASITGAITSGAAGSKLRFYYANVAAFPSATTYEGGLAFAEDTNRMYFATDTNWLSLAPELDPAFSGTPTAPTASKGSLGGQNTTQIATLAYVKDVVSDYAPLASPALTGNPTAPTAATADNDTTIATTGHVWANRNELQANIDLKAPLASPSLTGVPTAPTQATGTRANDGATTQISNSQYVRNVATEIYNAVDLKAPLASPALTGTPTTPTAAANVNNTQIASTQYVTTGIGAAVNTINTALALKAPLASPALTGTPTAPTANVGSNDTTIASTAYVGARIDAKFDDASYLTNKLSAYALKASPALTGTPTAPTAAAGTNDTQIATTAFTKTAIDTKVTDINLSQYATKASPTFTGVPLAPTPADNTNNTQIATTAFVKTAIDTKVTDINLSQYAKVNSQVFTGTPTVPTPSDNNDTLQISNTAFVQNWTATYGNVPKWGGARKYVNTSPPIANNGDNGDIWIQPGLDDFTTVLYSVPWDNVTSKPSFFDGAYSSLSGKPSLFDGNYNNLSNRPVSFDVASTPVFDGVVDWTSASSRRFEFRIKFENGIDARELVSPEQFISKITLNDYYTIFNYNTASTWTVTFKAVSVFRDGYANFAFTLGAGGFPSPNKINLTIFKVGGNAVTSLVLLSNSVV